MRILHITPTDPRRSGIATYGRHFADALRYAGGFEVDTLADVAATVDPRFVEGAFERVRQTAELMLAALPGDRYDVIHAELGTELSAEFFFAYHLARGWRTPLVLTIHDAPYTVKNLQPYVNLAARKSLPARLLRHAVNRTVGRSFERSLIRRASTVLVLNRRAEEAVAKRHAPARVEVIRHVAPIANPTPRGATWDGSRPLRILFAGFVYPKKGVPVLIEAVSRLHRDPALAGKLELTVCGGSVASDSQNPHAGAIDALVRERGLSEIVTLTGFVPDDELAAQFARSDVIVLPYLPSKELSTSGPLIHGMALGLVPIVTSARAMDELVVDSRNGFVVPAGDATAIEERLRALLTRPELIATLSRAAYETIRDEYSWRAVADRMSSVYARVAPSTRPIAAVTPPAARGHE